MKWDRKSSADVLKCLLSFHFLHKTLLLPSLSKLYFRCYHIHRSLFKISEIVLWKIAIIRYWIYKGKRALHGQLIACTFAQKNIIPELSKTYHHLVENLLSPYITQLSSKLSGLRGLFWWYHEDPPKNWQFCPNYICEQFWSSECNTCCYVVTLFEIRLLIRR